MPSMSSAVVGEISAGTALVVGTGVLWALLLRSGASRWRVERREHARARRAHAAAVEASLSDVAFSPDRVLEAVDAAIQTATELWQGRDLAGSTRRDDRVIRDWVAATSESLGPALRVVSAPKVDFLQVINREGSDEDRVILRVRLRLHRGGRLAIADPHNVTCDMRWTLGRRQAAWHVLSITSDPLAAHVLDGALVPGAWADDQRLREQALAELAEGGRVPDRDLAGLVSADHSPTEQLLELGALDQRFDRQLLDATIEHVVQAWEVASNGGDGALRTVASEEAAQLLVAPTPGERLVLRDARIETWEPRALVLSTTPPKLEINLTVSAVRYLVIKPTRRHVGGSVDARHEITLTWTLVLRTSASSPWRLIHTTSPAASLRDFRS
jgi:hypothetical protein